MTSNIESPPLDSPIRIGIIGLGAIGRIQAEVLTSSLTSEFSLGAASGGSFPNVTTYNSYQALLQNGDVAAVSIATPPSSHFEIAHTALEAGKHVLLEKPPALKLSQLALLQTLAEQRGLTIFTGLHAIYQPGVAAAKGAMAGKDVRSVDIRYGELVTNYHQSDGWIFDPAIAGGGVLMDSGINAISVVCQVLPQDKLAVMEAHMEQRAGFGVETKADVAFQIGNSGTGSLAMDWFKHGDEVREIAFETTQGDVYLLDIVRQQLRKNDELVFGADTTDRTMVGLTQKPYKAPATAQ